jgi:hypothetical protein
LLFSRGSFDKLANALPGVLGRIMIHLADRWYVRLLGPKENTHNENMNLASRIRRRTATARYFYLLIIGLMDDRSVPAVPKLGDLTAEQRLAEVSLELQELITQVRNEPGPWQDSA